MIGPNMDTPRAPGAALRGAEAAARRRRDSSRPCQRCGKKPTTACEIGFPALEVTLCVVCSEETCAKPRGAYHAEAMAGNAFRVFPLVRDLHVAPEEFPGLVRRMMGDRAAAALAPHGDEAQFRCSYCRNPSDSPGKRRSCRPKMGRAVPPPAEPSPPPPAASDEWVCAECRRGAVVARGLCRVCYDARDHRALPMPPRRTMPRAENPCPCGKKTVARGLCQNCYSKARYHRLHPEAKYQPKKGKRRSAA